MGRVHGWGVGGGVINNKTGNMIHDLIVHKHTHIQTTHSSPLPSLPIPPLPTYEVRSHLLNFTYEYEIKSNQGERDRICVHCTNFTINNYLLSSEIIVYKSHSKPVKYYLSVLAQMTIFKLFHPELKGVFAKNKKGYMLTAKNYR